MPSPSPVATPDAAIAARRVGANELGVIPVLMYHRISKDPGEFDITPRAFRRQLSRLRGSGYFPIRTIDLVSGRMDVPAGKTPVVLTFDDSSPSQFGYRKGKVDPTSAVAILLDLSRKHSDFPPVASFYVNAFPFASSRGVEMLGDLHRRGFEIGNHSYSHANLAALPPAGIREELALAARMIYRATENRGPLTLSYPLGAVPGSKLPVRRGSWDGIDYEHVGALLVGSNPAPSPFSMQFEPLAIPRIRASSEDPEFGAGYWLDLLARKPRLRFVSDGDPDTISFPRRLAGELAPRFQGRAVAYTSD